jgi:hypothetical protein
MSRVVKPEGGLGAGLPMVPKGWPCAGIAQNFLLQNMTMSLGRNGGRSSPGVTVAADGDMSKVRIWLNGFRARRRAQYAGEWSTDCVCPYAHPQMAAAWEKGRANRGNLDHLMEW